MSTRLSRLNWSAVVSGCELDRTTDGDHVQEDQDARHLRTRSYLQGTQEFVLGGWVGGGRVGVPPPQEAHLLKGSLPTPWMATVSLPSKVVGGKIKFKCILGHIRGYCRVVHGSVSSTHTQPNPPNNWSNTTDCQVNLWTHDPTQPTKNKNCRPIPNPSQPNPWVNPTHGQLWGIVPLCSPGYACAQTWRRFISSCLVRLAVSGITQSIDDENVKGPHISSR